MKRLLTLSAVSLLLLTGCSSVSPLGSAFEECGGEDEGFIFEDEALVWVSSFAKTADPVICLGEALFPSVQDRIYFLDKVADLTEGSETIGGWEIGLRATDAMWLSIVPAK